jgi:hypothetical protein
MSKLILTLPLVYGVQGALACLLYRSRVVSHASWTGSDFLVFGVPLMVGFAGSVCILFFSLPKMLVSKRVAALFGLSAVGTAISSLIGVVVAFNLYGT